MGESSETEEPASPSNLRRRVLPLLAALTLLWMLNLYFLGRGENAMDGLRGALQQFGYDSGTASLLESETEWTPLGLKAKARFLTSKDVEVEIHGKRTLAFLDWRVTSLVSWGK